MVLSFFLVGPLTADETQSPLTTKDLNILQWRHIGPWTFSGRITDFAVPEGQSQVYYVATASGGVWKTEDVWKTWTQVLDLKDRGVGDFVIDPSNSNIIIAGAYKTYRRAWTFLDRQEGNHFYKSIDGGKTWKKLIDGLPMDIKSGWNGITIYPKNPNILYIRYDEEVNVGLSEREGKQGDPLQHRRDRTNDQKR